VPSSSYGNVFFYFRGPSAKAAADALPSVQIEDNTTKALINVLQEAKRYYRGGDEPDSAEPSTVVSVSYHAADA
jgi:hypothetical protein